MPAATQEVPQAQPEMEVPSEIVSKQPVSDTSTTMCRGYIMLTCSLVVSRASARAAVGPPRRRGSWMRTLLRSVCLSRGVLLSPTNTCIRDGGLSGDASSGCCAGIERYIEILRAEHTFISILSKRPHSCSLSGFDKRAIPVCPHDLLEILNQALADVKAGFTLA